MTSFLPSSFQEAFFSELVSGTSSIILNAVAGSGKTTTIVHATSLLPPHVLTVFLAFNKRIEEELTKRLPSFVQCSTFHSRAYSALRRSLPKSPKVNKDKVRDILKLAKEKKFLSYEDYQIYSQFVVKLVSLAKSAGLGTSLEEALGETPWEDLAIYHGLFPEKPGNLQRGIELAQKVLAESNSDLSQIDFDDMLYLALLHKVRFDLASFIFVDEAQDTNSVQRALLAQMMGPTTRLIAVGDPLQAIYGFRGADSEAMPMLQQAFSMKPMDLSICYRCSQAVIREVKTKLNL